MWVDAWVDGSELVWVAGSVDQLVVLWDVRWEASWGSTIIEDDNKNPSLELDVRGEMIDIHISQAELVTYRGIVCRMR